MSLKVDIYRRGDSVAIKTKWKLSSPIQTAQSADAVRNLAVEDG
jgi:hypothetical protein